jgi:hypothetical protein
VLVGEPIDSELDVGVAIKDGKDVNVAVYSGVSVLDSGSRTKRIESIAKLLSPISMEETSTIRCIGLNVGIILFSYT